MKKMECIAALRGRVREMSVVYKHKDLAQRLEPGEYASEDEFQGLLAENPGLIVADGEPDIALVTREFSLKAAGSLDLLLVDSEGRLTAVEAKLARNVQSRREVVGQVFDYVSALSQYTVDELDRELDGRLEEALRGFCKDNDENTTLDKLWEACSINLRAGRVRVVVAVDDAAEELVRIMQYISDHSDLDIRLVTVKKYNTPDNDLILVPNLLVLGGANKQVSKGGNESLSARQQEYVTFYKDLLHRIRGRIPTTLVEPAPRAYYQIPNTSRTFRRSLRMGISWTIEGLVLC